MRNSGGREPPKLKRFDFWVSASVPISQVLARHLLELLEPFTAQIWSFTL